MSFSYRTVYFDDPPIRQRVVDLWIPDTIQQSVAVYFVHGGGWSAGSREGFHTLMQELRLRGFACASVDYRYGGSMRIGDQILDVRQGYRIFRNALRDANGPDRVCVWGSSAGAHLAALLALSLPGDCGEPTAYGLDDIREEWIRPIGAVLQATPVSFEPWGDMFPHIWSAMRNIVGYSYDENQEAFRRVSPILHVGQESPPLFFIEAGCEHMFPLRMSEDMVERMRKLGRRAELTVYPGVEHGFLYELVRKQQICAFEDALKFIESLA